MSIYVPVILRANCTSRKRFEADFLIDTGAGNTIAPAKSLREAGIEPVGVMAYELTDGSKVEYAFGLAVFEFMGEITSGRVIFGPDDAEARLGGTALRSAGFVIDPASQKLKRLPAVPLK